MRLFDFIKEVANTAETQDLGGGATEAVKAVGPAEFVLHCNGDGNTTALRLFGFDILTHRSGQMWWSVYTPFFYYGDDFFLGRLLRVFGRTVWSTRASRYSPTQED